MNRIAAFVALYFLASSAAGQLVEFPLPSQRLLIPHKGNPAGKTQVIDESYLPFFEDFSSSDTLLRDSLWLYGNSVLLNNGIGIRPPSRNVVTFDGVDSLGKPYSINDVLAKGYADQLVSQPIRMDLVDLSERNTVYFSFFYELEGRGEPPDPGDELILSFKNADGIWEDVLTLEPDVSMPTDSFMQVILAVDSDRFYHNGFQFRFHNLARLSGPYDSWNVDYIYLNKGRTPSDLYYPDRTISSDFTSLFKDYFAMPVPHFLQHVSANQVAPSLELYNLKLVDFPSGLPHSQPINYTTSLSMSTTIAGTTTVVPIKLDSAQYPGSNLNGLEFLTISLNKLPDSTDYNQAADSIHLRLKYGMATKDNIPTSQSGDYDSLKYSPIDFRYSDSLYVDYVLSSYYAYDDGTAEYAAGLNQAGSYLAFEFEMKTDTTDTLVYVDIYFPEFGDNTNQSLQLQVRSILGEVTLPPLLDQLIAVNRTTRNKFTRYVLAKPVPVSGVFYVGWKQITNASIPVGLDKNTDNGGRIYYNITGDWVQNTLVNGTIMVRPGFGKGNGDLVTGLEPPPSIVLYPNPNTGVCYIKAPVDQAQVFDLTGRMVATAWESQGTESRITFDTPTPGLYVVRLVVNGHIYTRKIIVQEAGRR